MANSGTHLLPPLMLEPRPRGVDWSRLIPARDKLATATLARAWLHAAKQDRERLESARLARAGREREIAVAWRLRVWNRCLLKWAGKHGAK